MKKKFQSIKKNIPFENGLIPTIIQDVNTHVVLMLGFMNEESYQKSIDDNKVTFYSRSKKRLWTKGEISKNYLFIKDIMIDCDGDALLIKAIPQGPVCHKNTYTCWKENNDYNFLFFLENLISKRILKKHKNSYVFELSKKGLNKIIQKFGEESVELMIESKDNNKNLFMNESADLLFHYLVLLQKKQISFQDIINVLKNRHKNQ